MAEVTHAITLYGLDGKAVAHRAELAAVGSISLPELIEWMGRFFIKSGPLSYVEHAPYSLESPT